MHEELANSKRNKLWKIMRKPKGHIIVGIRWVYKNKLDDSGAVVRN